MRLGEFIAVAREINGLTLRELEKRTGISNALISQIETGHVKEPGWRTIVKLARALNLNLDRLASCEAEEGELSFEKFPPDPSKAKGGHARAEALSPERRVEIAKKAADARWNGAPETSRKEEG